MSFYVCIVLKKERKTQEHILLLTFQVMSIDILNYIYCNVDQNQSKCETRAFR